MSDTHPNAFRLEAQEKRIQGQQLLGEADGLDAKADVIEGVTPDETPDKTPKTRKRVNGRFVKAEPEAAPEV